MSSRHKKGARVAYVSSEKFTNEYIDGIQNNQLARFRKKYRQTDVLLIDDIQFLAGKERIQEEFFHTFNALHEAHKQIVLTCDRPASEIQNLEQRLVSRFEWGLVTDLQPPDVEMRLAILKKKAQIMGVQLPEEIMNFLANRIRTNIRRLEGALIRVASYASLTGKKLSLEMVEGLLREILNEEGRYSVNIEVIQKKVAEHFDIRLADMTSKRRPENIAFPRQVAMFLSRQMTETSLERHRRSLWRPRPRHGAARLPAGQRPHGSGCQRPPGRQLPGKAAHALSARRGGCRALARSHGGCRHYHRTLRPCKPSIVHDHACH